MKRDQRGVSLLLVGVMLILIVGSILAFLAIFSTTHAAGSTTGTRARLARAQGALEQFASQTGRLPCPANPALDTGDEDRTGGSTGTCTFPQGTLPWRTIGLGHDDGLDSWTWKISYRVYLGAAGSLTQDGGASMVQCDTNVNTSNPNYPTDKLTGGICRSMGGWHMASAAYLLGKGLKVNDFGTTVSDVAYVLISHGPTGLGGYTSAGVQQAMPLGANELTNTSADGGPGGFVAQAASTVNLPASSVNFFDDILAYRELPDFFAKANLVGRDWPDPSTPIASVTANIASVSAALGTTASYGDLGQSTISFSGATASVTSGGTSENLTLGNAAGVDGIGGGGGGTTLSSAESEVLHIAFGSPAQIFAVTLNGFGCRMTAGVCTDSDSVQLTFFNGATQVGLPIVKKGCNTLNVASFTVDLGASPAGDFNRVDIAPQPTDPAAGVTQFFLGGFVTCAEGPGACVTATDSGPGPTGNHCS